MITREDRFWLKVNKEAPNGCWEWTAAKFWTGYGAFCVEGRKVGTAHRYAYQIMVGPLPGGVVLDHTCHNRGCVNPAHLRPCQHKENIRNAKLSSANNSGFKGVSWSKAAKRWRAAIVKDGKQYHLGFFDDARKAHAAYCKAANRLHGEFANSGKEAA